MTLHGTARKIVLGVLFLSAVWTPGCGGGPTSPGVAAAGRWSGTLTDRVAGTGTALLTLEKSADTNVIGTFDVTLPQGFEIHGTAEGAGNPPIVLNLSCGTGQIVGNMFLTLENDRLRGTHVFFRACTPLSDGTVDFGKR